MHYRILFIPVLTLLALAALTVRGADLPSYETPYYVIHTDLDANGVREATVRMTKMAEEYYSRTRDFSGEIRQKLPFYLYKNADDYLATGAPKGSAGFFDGEKLVALASSVGPRTWHTVQHEAFHQFAHSVIRGDLPVWVNEGLAEYFGEGLFTGDEFITGVIPQWRLSRIRTTLADKKFKPLDEMMNLTTEQWNSNLAVVNYDQGWSMVQFLAHGDNGKYRQQFGAFVGQLGQFARPDEAWNRSFGDTRGFEEKWRDYWSKLPDNPTVELYARANTSTLTSFLARAFSQRQMFTSFDSFRQAAAAEQIRMHPEDWLPQSLLTDALIQTESLIKEGYSYALVGRAGERPQLVCTMPNGKKVVGQFTVLNGRVSSVTADIGGGK